MLVLTPVRYVYRNDNKDPYDLLNKNRKTNTQCFLYSYDCHNFCVRGPYTIHYSSRMFGLRVGFREYGGIAYNFPVSGVRRLFDFVSWLNYRQHDTR